MKTAVEYLVEQLMPKALTAEQYYHIEQAKEMEKKQRQKDTEYGYAQGYDDHANGRKSEKPVVLYIELYYNETFKSE